MKWILRKSKEDLKNVNKLWFGVFAESLEEENKPDAENCLFNYFVDFNEKIRQQIAVLFFEGSDGDFFKFDEALKKLLYYGNSKITNFFPYKTLVQRIWKKYGKNLKYKIDEIEEIEERKAKEEEERKKNEKIEEEIRRSMNKDNFGREFYEKIEEEIKRMSEELK